MDYYKTLNISNSASPSDIKSAFRKLSMKYHPDKGGDGEMFKKINEAYQTLGDAEKKRQYDFQRKNPFMNGVHRNVNHMSGNDMHENIFKMFFGGQDPFSNQMFGNNVRIFANGVPVNMHNFRKPTPIIKTINITLEEAFNGKHCAIEIERWLMIDNEKRTEKEKIYVDIPKGIDNNEIIFVREKGNIINENIKGDIKLFIKISNNTKFKRKGLDLYYNKNISLKEALTGFKFDLKYFNDGIFTINSEGDVIIKPNFNKVIKGLGLSRGEGKGDLIIVFNIEFPKYLSEKQKQQLKLIL